MTDETEKEALELARRVLRTLEWSSRRYGPTPREPELPPLRFPACPNCRGVMPGANERGHFLQSEIGHSEWCELAAALKQQQDKGGQA